MRLASRGGPARWRPTALLLAFATLAGCSGEEGELPDPEEHPDVFVTAAGTLVGRLVGLESATIRFRTLEDAALAVERHAARTATFEAGRAAEPDPDLAGADASEDLVVTRDGEVHAGRIPMIDATSVVTVDRSFRRTTVHRIVLAGARARATRGSTKGPESPAARCWSGWIAIALKGRGQADFLDADGSCTGIPTAQPVFMHWKTSEKLRVVLEEDESTLQFPTRGFLRFRAILPWPELAVALGGAGEAAPLCSSSRAAPPTG